MAIAFPNRSRSHDTSSMRVRFWGHDGPLEISFFIEDRALTALDARASVTGETSLLTAFDTHIARIQDVAARFYRSTRRRSYVLVEKDF